MSDLSLATTELFSSGKRGKKFSSFLGRVVDTCVILTAVLTPLWFLPMTMDVLEINKQTLIILLASIALIAWMGKAFLDRSVSITRSWLHLIVLCFLGGYAVTTWFSFDRYMSFVGNTGQMQWAFVTIATLTLLYFLIVNRFRSAGQVYDLILWFLLGSTIAGIYGLLQMTGLFVFPGAAASRAFNTVGTVNALGVFMVIPTVLAASLTVLGCREKTCILSHESWIGKFWQGVVWVALIVGLLTAVAVDYWVIWAGLLFGDLLLVVLPLLRTRRFGHPVQLVVPATIAILSILLILFRTPIDLNLPTEVSPSATHTVQIARQTLRDHPLFGTGPGTWLYDYARYRSVETNLSQFWNIRFERGLSAFLTLAAMLGIIGTAVWLVLVMSAIIMSCVRLIREKNDDLWQAYLTVFTTWLTLVFLAFLYNYNVAHHLAFWFLLALLGIMGTSGEWRWTQRNRPWMATGLSALFIVIALGAIGVMWFTGQRYVAEVMYAKSVNSFQKGGDITRSIEQLEYARSLNPLNDAFDRNLSQAYLVRASRMISMDVGEETEKKMRDDLARAVELATNATRISPVNVDNWSNLAAVHQAIVPIMSGADEHAIEAYEEALHREPNNPVFMDEIGKLHLFRFDTSRTQAQNPDDAMSKELEAAADWFNRAIVAKPDFAPAHFNLGVVYERQGKLKDAVTKLEQVLNANPRDVGVAFQLATLYARTENKVSAKALFEQIVAAAPEYANARWLLSALYEEEGRYDDAIVQVEAVKDLNPNDPNITSRLEALKKARDEKVRPSETSLTPLPESIGSLPEQNPVTAP